MYTLYRKALVGNKASYQFVEQASLFGCNKGYIPWLLSFQIPTSQGEPFRWYVDVEASLARRDDVNGNTLIIDLKPKNASSISLYEVAGAWGYSDSDWTPIMMHLRGLFVEQDRSKHQREEL